MNRSRFQALLVTLILLVSGHGYVNWTASPHQVRLTHLDVTAPSSNVPPTIQDFYMNSTWAGQPANFSFYCSDTVALSTSTFSCNATGTFVNQSMPLSGNFAWSNFTVTLPSQNGIVNFTFWLWNTNTTLAPATIGYRVIKVYWYYGLIKHDHYDDNNDNIRLYAYETQWQAQTFNTTASYSLSRVKLKLYRYGNSTSVTVGIRAANSSGYPTGSDLASSTFNDSSITTSTSGAWYFINMTTTYVVSFNTTYAIVVRTVSGDSNDYVAWRSWSAGTYTGGYAVKSTDNGTSWSQIDVALTYENQFETWQGDDTTWNTPYFCLGDAINDIENANNWGQTELYEGVVLDQNSTADLQTMIDNYVTAQDWTDALKWLAVTNKLNLTWANKQNDINYILGNYTMVANLPYTGIESAGYCPWEPVNSSVFSPRNKWALYGYYYANQSASISYNSSVTTKWNITAAYQQFNTSVFYSLSHTSVACTGLPCFMYNDSTGCTYTDRFYDEDASTIDCYLIWYALLNVTDGLSQALYCWNYLNPSHWNPDVCATLGGGDPTLQYYRYDSGAVYSPSSYPYNLEFSMGWFLTIISELKYYCPTLGNWTRILTDVGTRYLTNEWSSYQWGSNVVVHDYTVNLEHRLDGTLCGWLTMLAAFLQMNSTYQKKMEDMLYGNNNTQPAWALLLASGAGLWNATSKMFRPVSGASTSYNDTAFGEILMFMLGIVPSTSTVAYPLEELDYNYLQELDPAMLQFQLNQTTRALILPVVQAGAITFQYGTSSVTYDFSQSGVWRIDFSDSWNTMLNATYRCPLPNSLIYFSQAAPPAPRHNVAVTAATPYKTVVGQGQSTIIKTIPANQGNYAETFNVTVYANTTAIETQTITLTSGDSATLIFTWNTTGFAHGNYTIWAYAWPVSNETDVTDNTFTYGLVYVGIPGDVDASGIVNMLDLYSIALHYGASIGQPDYVANYDIDDSGLINMLDLYIAALHYGQSDP